MALTIQIVKTSRMTTSLSSRYHGRIFCMPRTEQNKTEFPTKHAFTIKTTTTHFVAQVINLSTNSSNLYSIVYLLNTGKIYFSRHSHHYCFYFNLSLFNSICWLLFTSVSIVVFIKFFFLYKTCQASNTCFQLRGGVPFCIGQQRV